MSATVICTLGVHRSGTSLASRVLGLIGVHLGSDARVQTSGRDNPKGYWEYRPFVDISDAILERFGGRWDDPPSFPPSWAQDPRLDDLRQHARTLLAEDFAAQPMWGWKDPRTCLTLPFWQDVIGPMHYVVCLRNPCAVIASLTRREAMSSDKAERLWLAHMQAVLAHTVGQPRIFVSYERLIDDMPQELRRLADFVGAPERAEDPETREAVSRFVERDLCHHRMSMDDLAGDLRLSYPTKSLYLALMGHAALQPSRGRRQAGLCPAELCADRTLDLLGTRALHAWDRTVDVAAERASLLADLQGQTSAMAEVDAERTRWSAEAAALGEKVLALLAEARAAAARETLAHESMASLEAELRRVTQARDDDARRLAAVRRAEAERERLAREMVAGLESDVRRAIAEREACAREVDACAREGEAARQALDEIHGSSAWKLITMARRVLATLFPHGSARRRTFSTVVRRLTGADADRGPV